MCYFMRVKFLPLMNESWQWLIILSTVTITLSTYLCWRSRELGLPSHSHHPESDFRLYHLLSIAPLYVYVIKALMYLILGMAVGRLGSGLYLLFPHLFCNMSLSHFAILYILVGLWSLSLCFSFFLHHVISVETMIDTRSIHIIIG
jgi:hypothetical protein